MKCKICKKETNFLSSIINNGICNSCNVQQKELEEKKMLAKEKNDEREVEISDMIYEILTKVFKFKRGYYDDGDEGVYIKNLKNGRIEIGEDEIKKNLRNKKINYDTVAQFVNYKIELEKIKMRSKQYELRKKAEVETYGKPKPRRQFFSDDDKSMILERYGNKCAICNKNEGLHIHHKDQTPENNQLDNLIVLCGVCHKKIHMNVR